MEWSEHDNLAWKTEIPGVGWSSPVVWGDRVFLTSAVKVNGKLEKVQPGLYFGGDRPTPKEPHRWNVVCLDFKSGKILWEKTAFQGVPKQGHHLKNTLASETPVTDGDQTFMEWSAEFDCAPERETELVGNIGGGVFQGGFDALKRAFGG